jgi:hypothetical protein
MSGSSPLAAMIGTDVVARVKDVLSIFLLMIMPAVLFATHSEATPRQFGVYYGTRFDPELSAFDVSDT